MTFALQESEPPPADGLRALALGPIPRLFPASGGGSPAPVPLRIVPKNYRNQSLRELKLASQKDSVYKQFRSFILPSIFLIAASAVQAAPVNVESIFTGGIFGNFNFQYNSAAPGLKLQSVKFELQAPLFTDPSFTAPGSLLPLPFLVSNGAALRASWE